MADVDGRRRADVLHPAVLGAPDVDTSSVAEHGAGLVRGSKRMRSSFRRAGNLYATDLRQKSLRQTKALRRLQTVDSKRIIPLRLRAAGTSSPTKGPAPLLRVRGKAGAIPVPDAFVGPKPRGPELSSTIHVLTILVVRQAPLVDPWTGRAR